MLDILRRTVGAGPHFFRLISDNLRSITRFFKEPYREEERQWIKDLATKYNISIKQKLAELSSKLT